MTHERFPFAPFPDDAAGRPSVVVASAAALPLRTRKVDHPSIPDGAIGLGTFVHGKLLGRQAMSADTVPTYQTLLRVPRRLAYLAYEKDDGSVEGQLAAVLRPSEVAGDDGGDPAGPGHEPWRASVPSFEDGPPIAAPPGEALPEGADLDDENHVALLPLGLVVRMAPKRTHPEDLAAEAVDVLRSVVSEGAMEIVDQFLDTL